MRINTIWAAACLGLTLAHTHAQTLTVERLDTGYFRPVFVTHAPNDDSRIFIVEQRGRIWIFDLNTNARLPTPFISIDGLVSYANDERGLLGLAFHPDYQTNGLFYINYSDHNNRTVIAEYTVLGDPGTSNSADTESRRTILSIAQPQTNHNGGWIDFGPNDGFLYIASGDGGGGGDDDSGHNSTIGNGQSLTTLLGKILRIDVNADDFPQSASVNYAVPTSNPLVGLDGRDEIWASGLRNPWRPSFDRLTGDLYIADVGQDAQEEINVQPAASLGGEDYGWRCREGTAAFNTANCPDPSAHTEPVHSYAHGPGCGSVTGGYVYRGCAVPEFQGWYFFADYCTDAISALTTDGTTVTALQSFAVASNIGTVDSVSSFGEDANGELYLCDFFGGEIYKIVPTTPVDLNNNGIEDSCEVPPCPADLNGDGILDIGDIGEFVTLFLDSDLAADFNADGFLDIGDIGAFVQAFLAGC